MLQQTRIIFSKCGVKLERKRKENTTETLYSINTYKY